MSRAKKIAVIYVLAIIFNIGRIVLMYNTNDIGPMIHSIIILIVQFIGIIIIAHNFQKEKKI